MTHISTIEKIVIWFSAIFAFLGTYFFKLGAENFEQFMAVIAVVFTDGFFGIWAGIKTEGFMTKKAMKVPLTAFIWILILSCILLIEKAFKGTFFLSETIIAPFMVWQLISALKNANRAGIIKNELLTTILEKIDKHKA